MVTPIKIDISAGDIITPKEIEYSYHLIIEDRNINLRAYNLETILAEKLQTILARDIFNTRMRDFYDVFTLIKLYGNEIDDHVLREAFIATSKKRGSIFDHIGQQLENIAVNPELQNLWKQYQIKYTYAADISFESVMSSVKTLAQKADII